MKFSRTSRSAASPDQLTQVRPGDSVNVTELDESMDPVLRRRLEALGFRDGARVTCLRRAPLGSPLLYRVCGAEICLRKEQAECIRVSRQTPDGAVAGATDRHAHAEDSGPSLAVAS